ncbi:MAG: AbrB/MazE/SpoVT family DNA-binding domain-containing protein [Dehalococcoidia bacterium]
MTSRRGHTRLVRPLRGGQITIPADFRKRLGIDEDSVLEVTLDDGELRLRPLHTRQTAGGSPWMKELYDLFAPVREEALQFSEEEIDEAIDAAVKAVREEHV